MGVVDDGKDDHSSHGLDFRGQYAHHTDRETMESDSGPLGKEYSAGTERRRYGHKEDNYGSRGATAQDLGSKRQRRRKAKQAYGEHDANWRDERRRNRPYRRHEHSVRDHEAEPGHWKRGPEGQYDDIIEEYATDARPDMFAGQYERQSSSASRNRPRISGRPDSGSSEENDLAMERVPSWAVWLQRNDRRRKAYNRQKGSVVDHTLRRV
ncbi:hypothetical protein V5799_012144 [Amblyomma americanum]|uniref:Uncharacterized protein n=1 Tax=Amblyomma americanum TaxID=6943 RepID=A0AAQ4EFA3_AMBAM